MSFDFKENLLHEAFKKLYDALLHSSKDGQEAYLEALGMKCSSAGVTLSDLLFAGFEKLDFYIGSNKAVSLTKECYASFPASSEKHYIDLPYLEYDYSMEKDFQSDLVDLYESYSEVKAARKEIESNYECSDTYYFRPDHSDKVAGVFDRENCETRVGFWLDAINLDTPAWKKKTVDAIEDYMRKTHPEDINNMSIFELVYVETHVDCWWALRDTTKKGDGITIDL